MIVYILGMKDLVKKKHWDMGNWLENSVLKATFLYNTNLQIKSIGASAEIESPRLFCQLSSD